jgi:hypothetical protein
MATHVLADLSQEKREAVSQGKAFPNRGPAHKDFMTHFMPFCVCMMTSKLHLKGQ